MAVAAVTKSAFRRRSSPSGLPSVRDIVTPASLNQNQNGLESGDDDGDAMIYSNSFLHSWNKTSTATIDSSGKSTHEKTGRGVGLCLRVRRTHDENHLKEPDDGGPDAHSLDLMEVPVFTT